jgi:hypothetical protein
MDSTPPRPRSFVRHRTHLQLHRIAARETLGLDSYGFHENRSPTHGYEPTREAAMQAFAASGRHFENRQTAIAFSKRPAASNPPNVKPNRRAILLSLIALGS